MDKIIDLEKLKAIKDVKQVEAFRTYTNNFTNLEKLKPEEVLYLNLCTWLEPKARAINKALKDRGGITLVDSKTKASVFFEKYDLFHSLLGELKPGSIREHTSGGHLFIPELRAAMLDAGEIKSLGNGFFDMGIKYAGKDSINYKPNSYFSMGTSVEKAVEILEKAVEHPKLIKFIGAENGMFSLEVTGLYDQIFKFNIKNGTAKFHPLNPDALKKI